jgi:hypothetical protein
MAGANTISIAPVKDGWVVMLTDGRELARFTGPAAKRDALRYVANVNPVRRHPPIDMVRRVRHESTRRWGASNPS